MFNINFHTEFGSSETMDNPGKQGCHNGADEWGESGVYMDLLGRDVDFGSKNYLCHHDVTPQIPPCGDYQFQKTEWMHYLEPEVIKTGKGPDLFTSASFDILKKYGSRCRRLDGENMNLHLECTPSTGLSVETMIQLAAENFIQTSSQSNIDLSVLSHLYPGPVLCHSKQDYEGVQLVQNLLLCAEKIGKKQYERANKLLLECDKKCSKRGTPVQRLVFYFIEALYEKIDRETGRITPKGLGKKFEDPLESLQSSESTLIAFHKELPLSQITQFAGIQAVLDNIAEARKVHFIDFEIRKGVQGIILMQALAARCERPIDHLKITAVGTRSKARIEETGRQLISFAQHLNLEFSFNVVMVDDISEINKDLFQLDCDEAIAICASFTLTHMISRPDRLEHLMGVIKTINPRVMVISEVETNCNSPIFVNRFVEALFFYGAYFESMADCLKNDEKHRSIAEETCFSSSIRNIVATEGEERKIRHVSIRVWRTFFMHFGLEETELSTSSMYQAHLVLKNFTYGNSFTFNIDGKTLIIGWKGTPMSSLSVWKFHQCPGHLPL